MEEKYLYGAAVQGIQDFIFRTNKLKEIAGASELVEEICTTKFEELVGKQLEYDETTKTGAVIHAAGNIKYIFDSREECEKIVRAFPKEVSEFAPGITISQAVIKLDAGKNFANQVDKLEEMLHTQRNRPMRSLTLGLMGIERSRQSALPVWADTEHEHCDEGTIKKIEKCEEEHQKLCEKAFGHKVGDSRFAHDFEELTGKNDWIAVIHADGNGMGKIVQQIGKDAKKFSIFSKKIAEATETAAQNAYRNISENKIWKEVIPIRPIILGGDDLTVVCRADIALKYVKVFLEEFEKQTHDKLSDSLKEVGMDRLTACAGIAFIKSSYPFYYGYHLAEELCSAAKRDSKREASCLIFHKVQDSFTEEYKDIIKRELTPQENISFQFGPYYLYEHENRWTINNLLQYAQALDGEEGNKIKSHLRKWMSLLHTNTGTAQQYYNRMISIMTNEDQTTVRIITTDKAEKRAGEKDKLCYPTYDVLAVHTITTQDTKNRKKSKAS